MFRTRSRATAVSFFSFVLNVSVLLGVYQR